MLRPALKDGFFVSQQRIFRPMRVEELGPDGRVLKWPSVPRRRRACHPCRYSVVSSKQESLAWSVLKAGLYAALAA